jgi:hypothetical protein
MVGLCLERSLQTRRALGQQAITFPLFLGAGYASSIRAGFHIQHDRPKLHSGF